MTGAATDRAALQELVGVFFTAFTSGPEAGARLERLRALFLAEAVIIRTCGQTPVVYGVDEFIAPRRALLEGGTLTGFEEWALTGTVEVFGDVGHWFGGYAKSWTEDGEPFGGRGMKTIQFVRTGSGWRISAAAWDDERDGLTVHPDESSTQVSRRGGA